MMIDILKTLESKFTSHNSVEVERTTLTRSEYDQIVVEIEALKAENELLCKDSERLAWLIKNSALIRSGGQDSPDPYWFIVYKNGETGGAHSDPYGAIDYEMKAMIENIIGDLK